MDKSRVVSFSRVIRFGLMTVVLFMAGCSSKSAQPVVATTSEATVTAMIEPTPTLEPTPTIAPKPDYINDDNSVQTDNGTVFVKDGKYMLYEPKTGEIREIKDISSDLTFKNIDDAQAIVQAMHAAEFANQNVADWLPGNLANNERFSRAINEMIVVGGYDGGGYVSVNGFKVDCVKVVNPTGSKTSPELGVIMLNVFGYKKPFPYIVGFFDESGKYSSFQTLLSITPSSIYPEGEVQSSISSNIAWDGNQKLIGDKLVTFLTLGTLSQGGSSTYQERPDGLELAPAIGNERTRLLKIQAKQAEIGFDYLVNRGGTYQVGPLFAEIERISDNGGIVIVGSIKSLILIDTEH